MAGTVRFWTQKQIDRLQEHRNDPWPKLERRFKKTKSAIQNAMRQFDVRRDWVRAAGGKYTDEALRIIADGFEKSHAFQPHAAGDQKANQQLKDEVVASVKKALDDRHISWRGVRQIAAGLSAADMKRVGRGNIRLPLRWGARVAEKSEKEKPLSVSVPVRRWSGFTDIEMDAGAYSKEGIRIGFTSRIDYKSAGYRTAMFVRGGEIFAAEGTHFNVIAAGLSNKKWAYDRERFFTAGVRFREEKEDARDMLVQEWAKELSSTLPRIRHPVEEGKFIKWYVFTSASYDGPLGERLAQKLGELRREDIIVYRQGRYRLFVKGLNQFVGVISPQRPRMPSEYHSTPATREIKDREAHIAEDYPLLWVFAGSATSLHKPRGGEQKVPWITLGAVHHLGKDETSAKIGENQENVRIVELDADGSCYRVRTYPLKDWSRKERSCITSIKEGANDTHHQIVECLKRLGESASIGILESQTDIPRSVIEKEIQFLVEDKSSSRKTWPGLYYDTHSQEYDFHPDWFQETLRYPKLRKEWVEHRLLSFGCLHAGYTTSDYEFFTKRYPEIILSRGVEVLAGVGDFIAGLKHEMLHRGEIFGGLNNTEQEEFAAELVATVMVRVFRVRIEAMLAAKKITDRAMVAMHVHHALLQFIYTIGNHDEWQINDGATPLAVFRDKLIAILMEQIGKILFDLKLPPCDIADIIRSHVILVLQHRPVYRLPSGILVALHHPRMGRAKTISLRAQENFSFSDCHVELIANFHTAIIVEQWEPAIGQRIAVQDGCNLTHTTFEDGKMKRVDFGPLYVRIRVQDKRIIMTESEAFPDSILKDPIPKGTDPEQLKTRLGLLRAR